MGLQDLKLIFDNSQRTYYNGHTVTGRLRVCTDSPEKIRSIIVKFKGEANTSWTEKETVKVDGQEEEVTIHYKDNDLYFENNTRMFGGTGSSEVLPRGEHFFQFSMVLPDHLPPSFEGKYGNIRYIVQGIIDNPWKGNSNVVENITVLSNIDLNFDPRYREPINREESKTFCCCCCKSGPLTLTVHVPTKGYVVGENIPLTVDVENASSVKISSVLCQLQQIVSYHSTSPSGVKKDVVDVVKFKCDGSVRKHDSKTWTVDVKVPRLPASMLQACGIIDVYYKIQVTAVPRGVYKNLEATFPIVIGTVPFHQNTVHHHSPPMYAQMQSVPMTTAAQMMPFPTAPPPPPGMGQGYMPLPQMATGFFPVAPSTAPPTYEDCTAGDVKRY